ncbi:MAG: GNAT family N-acetyltransferase [Actinobacteria bacterium]|nr:GNAT family N-acetyltransferase [Actinomycetota bacterium]
MSVRSDVLEWGRERVRVGPWRSDGQLAILTPTSEGPPPSPQFLRRCLDELLSAGYRGVVTAALTPPEQAPFLAVGFHEHERLRLLSHNLDHLPPAPDAPLRRAHEADRLAVLRVDAVAFRPFWQLDEWGLQDALSATPVARFRVVVDTQPERSERVAGYAICGRTQRRGYVQRLAVDPAYRGRGWGQALTLDGLRWMRRRGVERAVVNTQLDNDAAYALYLRLGFREERWGLAVLRQDFA